jgi:hypothetical protein
MILRSIRYVALMVAVAIGLGGCIEPFRPAGYDGHSVKYPGLCRLGHHPGGDRAAYWCEHQRW